MRHDTIVPLRIRRNANLSPYYLHHAAIQIAIGDASDNTKAGTGINKDRMHEQGKGKDWRAGRFPFQVVAFMHEPGGRPDPAQAKPV